MKRSAESTPYHQARNPEMKLRMRAMYLVGIFVLVSLSTILSSCGPSEAEYNTVDTSWNIVALSTDNPSRLCLLHEPENSIKQSDLYANANGATLEAQVTKIVEFDTALYLLMPSVQKIEVISRNSYKRIATISTAPHTVVDMCFANSTTAYTANSDSTVSIIDATIYRLLPARDIVVGSGPVCIAAVGNQLCVGTRTTPECVVISTSTNSITQRLSLPSTPRFIGGDKATGVCSIVCGGQPNQSTDPSLAQPLRLMHFDAASHQLLDGVQVKVPGYSDTDLQAYSFYVVAGGFAFVGVNDDLVMIDTKNRTSLGSIATGAFSSLMYNARRGELAGIDNSSENSQVTVVDLASTRVLYNIQLPMKIQSGYLP